jgi:hypothetical protein
VVARGEVLIDAVVDPELPAEAVVPVFAVEDDATVPEKTCPELAKAVDADEQIDGAVVDKVT